MEKRFAVIWFRYLRTDWHARRNNKLYDTPFVLTAPDHGRMMVVAVNAVAVEKGIYPQMALADARAIFPSLQVHDDRAGHSKQILKGLAEWCIRFTPFVAIDDTESLILDATGCAHLWRGEENYLNDIESRLKSFGYDVKIGMADTIGMAWAASRYGTGITIIKEKQQDKAILSFPATALRLEPGITERLNKLGLGTVSQFIGMPRSALRRRFGEQIIRRIQQVLGYEEEIIEPIFLVEDYQERLPCMEPIVTRSGIELALETLLQKITVRLKGEGKGIRSAVFKCFRVDGKVESIEIGTNRATHHSKHLYKLFELELDKIEPALGIEFFVLEASKVEDVIITQEKLWDKAPGLNSTQLAELLDRFTGKFGPNHIRRFVPAEHHWPEWSFQAARTLSESLEEKWKLDHRRPLQLLPRPEPIQVTAPIPDYPPMLFQYKGKRHKVVSADGPERIEQEWWLQQGEHRDYYIVENEEGVRYWIFRSGHYDAEQFRGWFVHGFFA